MTKRSDFKKVFDLGSKFPSKLLIIYTLPGELPCCRLGLAVSRKIGNAVVRNRIKRRLREIFRKQLTDKHVRHDFVVVARSASAEAEFADLQMSVVNVLSRLKKNEDTVTVNN